MRRFTGILVLCFLASAAAAGAGRQDLAAPQVLPVQAKTVSAVDDSNAPPNDLAALQAYLFKLKAERDALTIELAIAKQQVPEHTTTEGLDIAQMRRRVAELVNKLTALNAAKKSAESAGPTLTPPGSTEKSKKGASTKQKQPSVEKDPGKTNPQEVFEAGIPADPRALASVLFKAGNFEFALKAYRTVSFTGMKPDERAPIQYLMASCLRKMGKVDDAAALYREVANVRGDEQVAACAQWQLVYLRWRSEFEAQLKDVRERCKALEGSP